MVKKSKPKTVPRLHDIKVDEIVERARTSVHSSQERITQSKLLQRTTKEIIKDRQRKKRVTGLCKVHTSVW